MAGASEIADCHAAWMGGGIFQEWNSTTTLHDGSAVADCTCSYFRGGGVAAATASFKDELQNPSIDYPQDVKNMFIMKDDSQIRRCYSEYDAGGIYLGQVAVWAGASYRDWSRGGIWRPDAIEVSMHGRSSILGCKARRSGGGVNVESGGSFIMNDNSQLTRCTSGKSGGGIIALREALAVLLGRAKVSYNRSPYGGAAYVMTGTLNAQGHSSICHNHASYGGAVVVASEPTVLYGMYSDDASLVVLGEAAEVWNNTATFVGGGIVVASDGIRADSGFLQLHLDGFVKIHGNRADIGGGVVLISAQVSSGSVGESVRRPTLRAKGSVTIANNTAEQYGGGLVGMVEAEIYLNGTILADNVAKNGLGGGIMIIANSSADLNAVTIRNCSSPRSSGGGIASANSKLTLQNALLEDCTALYNGGGISFSHGDIAVSGSAFEGCIAGSNGAGLQLGASSVATVSGTNFTDCAIHHEGTFCFDIYKTSMLEVWRHEYEASEQSTENTGDTATPFQSDSWMGANYFICRGRQCPEDVTEANWESKTDVLASGSLWNATAERDTVCLPQGEIYTFMMSSVPFENTVFQVKYGSQFLNGYIASMVEESATGAFVLWSFGEQSTVFSTAVSYLQGGGGIGMCCGAAANVSGSSFHRVTSNVHGGAIRVESGLSAASTTTESQLYLDTSDFTSCSSATGPVVWSFLSTVVSQDNHYPMAELQSEDGSSVSNLGGFLSTSSRCPAGTHGNCSSDGSCDGTCAKCAIGRYGPQVGALDENSGCLECPEGHFSNLTGSAACTLVRKNYMPVDAGGAVAAQGAVGEKACPDGQYTDSSGSIACSSCENTFGLYMSSQSGDDCAVCVAGKLYVQDENTGEALCLECPDNMLCNQGSAGNGVNMATLKPAEEFYRHSDSTVTAHPCPAARNCRGNNVGEDSCRKGSGGPLCAVCKKGYAYHELVQGCKECSQEDTEAEYTLFSTLLVVSAILLALLVLLYFRVMKLRGQVRQSLPVEGALNIRLLGVERRLQQLTARYSTQLGRWADDLSIMVIMIQTTLLMTSNYQDSGGSTEPPASYEYYLECFEWLGLDVPSIPCITDQISFETKLGIHSSVFIGVGLVFTGRWYLKNQSQNGRGWKEGQRFVYFAKFFLPPVTHTICSAFRCTWLHSEGAGDWPIDEEYLMADMTINCYSERYTGTIRPWATVLTVLIPLGIPCTALALLAYNRKALAAGEGRGDLHQGQLVRSSVADRAVTRGSSSSSSRNSVGISRSGDQNVGVQSRAEQWRDGSSRSSYGGSSQSLGSASSSRHLSSNSSHHTVSIGMGSEGAGGGAPASTADDNSQSNSDSDCDSDQSGPGRQAAMSLSSMPRQSVFEAVEASIQLGKCGHEAQAMQNERDRAQYQNAC